MLLMVIELLALTLFVAGIFANHHHVAVATNDFALVAHGLNTGANLHGLSFFSLASCPSGSRGRSFSVLTCSGRRCGHGSGRKG